MAESSAQLVTGADARRWIGARMAACAIATAGGWFWLPCPVCGEHFGGQEWRDIDGLPSSVPNPNSTGTASGICPTCTRAGFGYPSEVAAEIWGRTEGWPSGAPVRTTLPVRDFANHIERMEAHAFGPTYPVWKRPLRRYRLHLIDPHGRTESDHFGTLKTKREAEQAAAEWNVRPLRAGYRVEVHRER